MGERLKGKVAVVTGAGHGIGRAEALAFAQEGARVVVNDLGVTGGMHGDGTGTSTMPADSVVAEIRARGGEAVANYDTVATAEGGNNIIKTAVDNFGRIDILVNNAGIMRGRMIFNMTPEEWDAVIKVHLYGVYNCTRPACVLMKQQKSGRIINTSSHAGLLGGGGGEANYGAAKEGIVGFTRKVAADMGRYGVTCNAIRPAAGTNPVPDKWKKAWENAGEASANTLRIFKRLEQLKAEDVAPLVVWLASDDAANVNGRIFHACTGRMSLYSEPVEMKTLFKVGGWTIDEVFESMPITLAAGLENPFPPSRE